MLLLLKMLLMYRQSKKIIFIVKLFQRCLTLFISSKRSVKVQIHINNSCLFLLPIILYCTLFFITYLDVRCIGFITFYPFCLLFCLLTYFLSFYILAYIPYCLLVYILLAYFPYLHSLLYGIYFTPLLHCACIQFSSCHIISGKKSFFS